MTADDIVDNVLALWDDENGWIPGASYRELAKALGVSEDRMLETRIARRARFKEDTE